MPESSAFQRIRAHHLAVFSLQGLGTVPARTLTPLSMQAFFGTLAGQRARKGVFITTSSFTREASEYGKQIAESVVLIDGVRLTRLMIEHGVADEPGEAIAPDRPGLL